MSSRGTTPRFRGPRGEPLEGIIAEVTSLRLGGIEQWVMLRGESVAHPLLILLHGGPGISETGLFRCFQAALERSFTVVYWDQRGAGKSYHPAIPRSSMTVEQFVSDLDELVDAVCARVGRRTVTLLGHSWGSALGVLYAARHPRKVACYVGTGQLGDWAAGEAASYDYALAEAQRRGDRRAVAKLRAIGPLPRSAESLTAERMVLSRLEGRFRPRAIWKLGRAMLGGEESSIFDLPRMMRGLRFSLGAMWPEVSRLDLAKAAPVLEVPVFFFLGRKDRWVPPETALAYFDALTAPRKQVVWFAESGHEPFVDEPARFHAAMIEHVRPIAADGATCR